MHAFTMINYFSISIDSTLVKCRVICNMSEGCIGIEYTSSLVL